MSKTRKANGQFKVGHHKIAKKHAHHKKHRKNPIGAMSLGRLAAKLKGASGVGRAARVLIVKA